MKTQKTTAVKKPRCKEPVAFNRSELTRILGVYGQFVAAGDWRDYAIDCLEEAAVFSIFRQASEMPLYRIEKTPQAGAQARRLSCCFHDRRHSQTRP